MLKVTKPNGVVVHAPKDKMPEIVLELSGGGYNELSTRRAMLNSDKLRNEEVVKINGYTLELTKEES